MWWDIAMLVGTLGICYIVVCVIMLWWERK